MDGQGLFWGVIIKPDKRYGQFVEEDFRITKACVEPSTLEEGKVASVYLETEDDEFIICNLSKPNGLDNSVDLAFAAGEKICFRTEGGAIVHLTGHLNPPEIPMDFQDHDSDDEEADEDEAASSDEETPPQLVKKRKMEMNGGSGDSAAKKSKQDKLNQEVKKSVKKAEAMKKLLSVSKDSPQAQGKQKRYDSDDDVMYEDMEDDDSGEEEEEEDDDEGESGEEEEEEEEESPVKKSPVKAQAKAKKDKSKEAKNGQTTVGKKDQKKQPQTPKSDASTETPKSNKKNKNKGENGQQAGQKSPTKEAKTPKRTLKGGLVVEEIKVGNGPEAKAGKFVGMYYDGKLSNGKRFDACKSGKPFKFKLGKGEVIKGWDLGVEGIKVGGKRKLTIPAHLAYGSSGAPPDIPPNATLVFDIECKMVN